MKGQDLITQIEKMMEKYGMDLEFFIHGPEAVTYESGFGPEFNWCVAKIELGSDEKPPEVIKAVFCYGLPLNIKGGPLEFPVSTSSIPIHTWLQKPL